MKKIARVLLIGILLISSMFAAQVISVNTNLIPAQFGNQSVKHGDGSSTVMYNADGLGTTTLFNGSSVRANGTAAGKNINFNIYGNDEFNPATKISASRQEFYLTSDGGQYIDTRIVPDGNTTLEIFFMLPNDYPNKYATTSNHPDVAGCNGTGGTSPHFGGPLLIKENDPTYPSKAIQYLYGAYPTNSVILTAKDNAPTGAKQPTNGDFKWEAGKYYRSILAASGGGAEVYLTDGTKTYKDSIVYSVEGTAFNSLFLFGQNNGSVTNQTPIGIKEVKITNSTTGDVMGHFFAVPKGSTEFSTEPARSNCMYDITKGEYFENIGSGNFGLMENSTNTNDISISTAMKTQLDKNLNGEPISSDQSSYTYIDGNNVKWAADYIEVNQEANKVWLHRYLTATPLTYEDPKDITDEASELLAIKTTSPFTVLGNDSGAWMDGIIGPIINYNIVLGTASAGITLGNDTISVLNLTLPITATATPASYTFAAWKATEADSSRYFATKKVEGSTTTITAKDILFSSDKLMQQYAYKVDSDYFIKLDIHFEVAPMTEIIVNITDNIGNLTGSKINDMPQTEAQVITGSEVSIIGVFDYVLYELDPENTKINGIPILDGSYNQNTITLTAVNSDTVTITYKIKPKKYSVQILGQTINKDDFSFEGMVIEGFGGEISYNEGNLDTLDIDGLDVEALYKDFMQTSFSDYCIYEFVRFECNGRPVTGELEIYDYTLKNNIRDEKFTIYAVYQKKYLITVEFEFEGEAETKSGYSASPGMKEFEGNGIIGHSVNDGGTAVIILKPFTRYSVLSVKGDSTPGNDGSSQIYANLPELLVVDMKQSYHIVVTLKNRTVQVDYALNISDTNSREIFGVAEYYSDGTSTNENHTTISVEVAVKTLTVNQTMLDTFNYRVIDFRIYNYSTKKYDLLTGGKLDANISNFFEDYVRADINPKVCLFVVQQYFIDFSTAGFDFDEVNTTFKNSDLGSYTVTFTGGEYTSLGSGKYAVDFGTKINLEKTVGEYGHFVGFTGLSEEESETGSFIVNGERYVGGNFQSTKLAAWIMPTIFSGSGVVLLLILMTILLVLRSMKLKREKLEKEAEIQDMKRKFSLAEEIAKLRNGDDVPQS